MREQANTGGIEIEQGTKAKAIIEFTATANHIGCTGKIPFAKTCKHLIDALTQPVKLVTGGDIGTAEDRENRFGLGLALHRNAIKLQHGKLIAKTRCRF